MKPLPTFRNPSPRLSLRPTEALDFRRPSMIGMHSTFWNRISLLLFGACCVLGEPQPSSVSAPSSSEGVNVKIKTGVFRGVTTADKVDKFLGIPFAQPPTGNLRFKAPVAITKASNTVRDASQFGNACPQPASSSLGAPIAEDCLFLNVWNAATTSIVFIPHPLAILDLASNRHIK